MFARGLCAQRYQTTILLKRMHPQFVPVTTTSPAAASAVTGAPCAGMDESGRKLYRARIEINSYPLETRMLISNKQSL